MVYPDEPIAVSATMPIGESYALKLRFRTHANTYRGETWVVTGGWLTTQTAWDEFPITSAGQKTLIGRVKDVSDIVAVQVVGRKAESEATEVLQEMAVQAPPVVATVRLQAYLPDHSKPLQQGYFYIAEPSGERHIPIMTAEPLMVSLSSRQPVISLTNLVGDVLSPSQRYNFPEGDLFSVIVNGPSQMHYSGIVEVPREAHPYETTSWHLTLDPPYSGSVAWYVDGEKLAATGLGGSHIFSRSGDKEIIALLENGQRFEAHLGIRSYDQIVLTSLLPNPLGSDAGTEELTLKNDNLFPVTLTHWFLKSRNSTTSIPITTSIASHATTTLKLSSKLRNSDGVYNLINESGEIVDTVNYATAGEGDHFLRSGLLWQSDAPKKESQTVIATPFSVSTTLEGTIEVPRGRTFTIMTVQGIVRVVLHPSYTIPKPRLHHNDFVRVSGIWKVSRLGQYLSVRAGNELTVLKLAVMAKKAKASHKTAAKKKPKKATVKTKKFTGPFSPQPVQANARTGGLDVLVRASRPLQLAYTPPLWLSWVFALMVTSGSLLLLPSRKWRTMA